MEPNLLGRKLGVGARVASRILIDRATAPASSQSAEAPISSPVTAAKPQVYASREKGKGIAQGTRNFGAAVWRPFAHASGVLWLEITGLFFGIFALFFAQNAWKLRENWRFGTNHQYFLVYAVMAVIFLYFTFSSFYRAARKQRKK